MVSQALWICSAAARWDDLGRRQTCSSNEHFPPPDGFLTKQIVFEHFDLTDTLHDRTYPLCNSLVRGKKKAANSQLNMSS